MVRELPLLSGDLRYGPGIFVKENFVTIRRDSLLSGDLRYSPEIFKNLTQHEERWLNH